MVRGVCTIGNRRANLAGGAPEPEVRAARSDNARLRRAAVRDTAA
jgi:hypothetical protein